VAKKTVLLHGIRVEPDDAKIVEDAQEARGASYAEVMREAIQLLKKKGLGMTKPERDSLALRRQLWDENRPLLDALDVLSTIAAGRPEVGALLEHLAVALFSAAGGRGPGSRGAGGPGHTPKTGGKGSG